MIKRYLSIFFIILSISSCENHDSIYSEYIYHFQETIQVLEKKNEEISKEFEFCKAEKPMKTAPYYEHLMLVKGAKSSLIQFLDSIASETERMLWAKANQKQFLNITELKGKIKLKKENAEKIKNAIIVYRDTLISSSWNQNTIKGLKNSIDTLFSNDKLEEFCELIGRNISFYEFLACYYMLKADITFAETDVISYLYSQIDCSSFKFHKIEVLVEPNSQILPIGYPYYSYIFPLEIDITIYHSFEIEGKEYPAPACKGTYSFKVAEKAGNYVKTGNFITISRYDSTIQKTPFKIEYEVLEKK
jgi:hypothetical protein